MEAQRPIPMNSFVVGDILAVKVGIVEDTAVVVGTRAVLHLLDHDTMPATSLHMFCMQTQELVVSCLYPLITAQKTGKCTHRLVVRISGRDLEWSSRLVSAVGSSLAGSFVAAVVVVAAVVGLRSSDSC